MPKMAILASFWKPENCGKTVLPDRSILIRQKWVEKAKIEKLKGDIWGDFQTLWQYLDVHYYQQNASILLKVE